MKKGVMLVVCTIILLNFASSLCNLETSLVNQDPVSAVPGETVKLLFQVLGTDNLECGKINLEFVDDYPFSLENGYEKIQSIQGGTYQRNFNSFWLVPFKVRVSSDSLDGENKLTLKTWVDSNTQLLKINDFNISVQEVKTDFIITIDSYSFSTNKLVLGILNIGKNNASALTIEIQEQSNVLVEGGNVKILGDLDSNDDATATFDAKLSPGSINVNLEYNDHIGERRKISKEIIFKDIAFENTKEKKSFSKTLIFLWVAIIALIIYIIILKRRARRSLHAQKFNK